MGRGRCAAYAPQAPSRGRQRRVDRREEANEGQHAHLHRCVPDRMLRDHPFAQVAGRSARPPRKFVTPPAPTSGGGQVGQAPPRWFCFIAGDPLVSSSGTQAPGARLRARTEPPLSKPSAEAGSRTRSRGHTCPWSAHEAPATGSAAAGGPRALHSPGDDGRPRQPSTRRGAHRPCTTAWTRIRPGQWGHAKASTSNTRNRRSAQGTHGVLRVRRSSGTARCGS